MNPLYEQMQTSVFERMSLAAARHGAVGARYGAAWSWTDPLLESLPTNVTDPEPAAV